MSLNVIIRAISQLRPIAQCSREHLQGESKWLTLTRKPTFASYKWNETHADAIGRAPTPWYPPWSTTCQRRTQMSQHACSTPVPALRASPKRTSVMLLGSLRDLPRCNTQSSSGSSDDAMVAPEAQFKSEKRNHGPPRSSASSGGAASMWL